MCWRKTVETDRPESEWKGADSDSGSDSDSDSDSGSESARSARGGLS